MVSLTEYFLCLMNPLTHFKSMFHFFWNQMIGLHAECPLGSQQSTKFTTINLVKMENIYFSDRPHVSHLIKGSCLRAFYNKSAPCLVWCRYIFCRLIYAFYLSRDPTKPFRWDVLHIHMWELFTACHQIRESYKYALPLKDWDDWTTTGREKNVTTSKMYILARSAPKLKRT